MKQIKEGQVWFRNLRGSLVSNRYSEVILIASKKETYYSIKYEKTLYLFEVMRFIKFGNESVKSCTEVFDYDIILQNFCLAIE